MILQLQNNNEQLKKALSISELNENKFRNIFNASLDAIVIISPDQYIVDTNSICLEKIGYPLEELRSKSFLEIVPEQYREITRERFNKIFNGEKTSLFEFEILAKNGTVIFVEINSHLIEYDGEKAMLSVIRDITERKKTQRDMMKITVEAEEKERKKLSSDLHDEVGPLLSSMNMLLSSLSNKEEVKKYSEITNDITSILKETIATVREISYNISPHILNHHGLNSAITNFFETKKGLVEIDFTTNLQDIRFSETVESMLYRILKEAFNNTIKYAEATKIIISLKLTGNVLTLIYQDNGIGFDLNDQENPNRGGLGLTSIVNRITSIGGGYSIETRPGKGFVLKIAIDTEKI